MLVSSAALLVATLAAAAPQPEIPEPLRPYTGWVLHGREAESCPLLTGGGERRSCLWPAALSLTLDDRGGRFSFGLHVFARSLLPLPGDDKRWPLELKVDGAPAALASAGGRPVVLLEPGAHTVTGSFLWDSLPEALQLPPQTALLSLTVRGAAVPFPNLDEEGRLWLQKASGEDDGEHGLDVVVHRQVADDVPLTLTTRIELRASGKNREELLGNALPAGFVPMAINAPIPARLEADGHLRVQLRPGTFVIELVARHEGPASKLVAQDPAGPWAAEEVWVFAARPHLRQVVVEGVPGIDPSQTNLPPAWRSLPAYRLRAGEAMVLTEKLRGDADPAPDRLSLSRNLWLDFDGGGYTIQDQLSGSLSRSWRLTMPAPTQLGRVSVSGQDLFITRLEPEGPAGVEIRQGSVAVSADSRLAGGIRELPAVGWAHDFQSVSATLHLPPGWRLLSASGADDVPGTWVKRWTLLDLFLLLITAVAVGRLFGPRAGVLCLIALGLTIPEEDSPQWAWLTVLAFEALFRVLPAGFPKKLVRVARGGALLTLILITLPFAVQQVRQAMYPALEHEYVTMGQGGPVGNKLMRAPNAPPPPPAQAQQGLLELAKQQEPQEAFDQELDGKDDRSGDTEGSIADALGGTVSGIAASTSRSNSWKGKNAPRKKSVQYRYEYDAQTVVQTGPGLPRWDWNTVELRWSGPVEQGQQLGLLLVSPGVNLALGFLRVGLLALLLLTLLGFPGTFWPGALKRGFARAGPAAAAALLLLLLAGRAGAGGLEAPPADLLSELQRRLLEKPLCFPACASISRLHVDATPQLLRLRLEASALSETAIPLPGALKDWFPAQVLVDGKPATALLRAGDGQLWLVLSPGPHDVLLEGPLPPREIVQLPLPLRPHRVEATLAGFSLEGLHEDGLADENLQLTRIRGTQEAAAAALQPGALPPFVRVERELTLGLTWELTTRVVRLTPPGTPVVLEVPLLPGESVTTAEMRVVAGKALVSMAPAATELSWRSALEQRPTLKLAAPAGLPWVESWRLDASPMWHVAWEGIPMIHQADTGGDRIPEFRPWPGETLTLTVGRPGGLPGQTLTVDRSELTVRPGARATDSTLSLTLRSSRGGQHVVTLPAGAQLQTASINGTVQPIRQEGSHVAIPLVPGSQEVQLVWREPGGIEWRFTTPEVDLGVPSVNAQVLLQLPSERWVLFARGPRMGPAVLIWSLLVILALVALGLGRVRLTPLKSWHWGLLAIGLSQLPLPAAAVVAGWLLALGARGERPGTSPGWFNLRQVGLAVLTLVALGCLFAAIRQGLLGLPDMQVTGNGASQHLLRWFQDRSGGVLPRPWVISVPLLVYRGAMLAWALWLAFALLGWLRWGFGAFGTGGLWKPLRPATPPAPPAAPAAK